MENERIKNFIILFYKKLVIKIETNEEKNKK